MLGAFCRRIGTVKLESLLAALDGQLEGKSEKIMDLNREAMKRGAQLAG